MGASLFQFVLLSVLSAGLVYLTLHVRRRLVGQASLATTFEIRWLLQGTAVPLLVWALMNTGLTSSLQPFAPQIQAAQAQGKGWFGPFIQVIGQGCFIVASYWCAVTLGWQVLQLWRSLPPDSASAFKTLSLSCILGLSLPALLFLVMGGWPLLGVSAATVLLPLAHYAPGVITPPKTPPIYARAIARMKFGKYQEAEWEIIRELEKSGDDFEGWLMLAELYATHFKDITQAESTIMDICAQPSVTPSQVSVALQKLADWHLRIGQDPILARRALQKICELLPSSHLAHMAELRIRQLPRSAAELRDQQNPSAIPLPALGDSLDHEDSPTEPTMSRDAAVALVRDLSEKLNKDPNHIGDRERFAKVVAIELGQAQLGIDQLQLLSGIPGQPEHKRAEWLGLIAAWQLRLLNDPASARDTLERIITQFPGSVQAFAARRRLFVMRTKALQALQVPPVPPKLRA